MTLKIKLPISRIALVTLLSMSLLACKKEQKNIIPEVEAPVPVGTSFTQPEITAQAVEINPSGYAPLTAYINLETSIPTTAIIKVVGKHGIETNIVKSYTTAGISHKLPVYGLYAGYDNVVELTLYNEAGRSLGTSAVYVTTAPIHEDLPNVKIDVFPDHNPSELTIVSYYGGVESGAGSRPLDPFIFDAYGDIRWYLNYENHSDLHDLHIQDGIERLQNGNLYFGDLNSNAIYEVNFMGEVIDSWPLSQFSYGFHHQVLELPNGNFLITVHNDQIPTEGDFIIEIDRKTKQVVTTWDLRQSLQQDRDVWTENLTNWIHVNAVYYSPKDDCIIISGRHQGAMKLTRDNKLVWILAPHRDWATAGDGTDLNTKLLQPLDKDNNPITDWRILHGHINHPDFEWNWYQHAPKIMPSGNIILFDNGDTRNYTGESSYSRAVEYEIDENNMTIKQVWQYGKERGVETYSQIVSDVDYIAANNSIVFSPGAIRNPSRYGKVIEVERNSKRVIFEATVTPPQATPFVTFHRTDKISF